MFMRSDLVKFLTKHGSIYQVPSFIIFEVIGLLVSHTI